MDRFEAFRRWRDNYYASRILAPIAKPIERACSAVALRLRSHIRKNGIRFTLPNGEILRIGRDSGIYLSSGLFWGGLDSFEPATSRTLRFFFSRAATFVDVGANYGFYSLLAAHWNPKLQVTAFEPVPPIFERLQHNIRLNQLQAKVNAYSLALSDASGVARLYVPPSQSLDLEATATLAQDSWQQRKNSPAIEVKVLAFDDFEREHPMRLDLVKIDVEDHEASVLRGMQNVIRRDRPFIVCEILPRDHRNERTLEIIDLLDYTPFWITPMGYIRISRLDFGRRDCEDFLLSPVHHTAEIVTDLEALWAMRQAASLR